MKFSDLGLNSIFVKAIEEKGYSEPTPIQAKAIPEILKGKDILASAQTGTGKTAGFTLPLLQRLSKQKHHPSRSVRALILTPTRELASQVYENVQEYSLFSDLKSTVVFGGVNQKPQVKKINKGIDVLVATPGRLLDLYRQKVLFFDKVEILVLDEADRMLDMGFHREISNIISLLPNVRQNLMFSATFSREIKSLAQGILNHPAQIDVSPGNTTVEAIIQSVFKVDRARKSELLIKLIIEGEWEQVLVFTRTKHGANNLCKKMISFSINAKAIHGNKSQTARTAALAGFKDGSVNVLVATDIAARGIDIPLLPHVVNFELPNIPEDYVHRIGRTGRAGSNGEAISLVSIDEYAYLEDIEKLIKLKIPSSIAEGFELDPNIVPEPAKKKKNSSQKNSNKRSGKSRKNKRRFKR
ncbi:DEAD/DEAH box helicase [Flavobacteriaceae bacterium]|nr:DEAD/DEAH box helicase [Flavobacteriaceae bacterium]MDC0110040.1 DEAD/DEAH box helicase [bacterium]MDA8934738.1 DEAD/DEAH box helicase [Flavobacteriaceae bacterium]MDA9084033.1 DEAD/DEAH box helicase [Flavobacteriaceae bacterium]MDA9817442.1 DEAD/DEAH box helicase [Flavobacteriaceae bacterium]